MNKIDTKALREKILDLAMRGKLVPQDPNDEPASVLLENIKQEKEQLVKDKVIKKQKPLPPIEKEGEPFEIPTSWEWVRLGDVGIIKSGGTPKTKVVQYWENGDIPWITPADMGKQTSQKFLTLFSKHITSLGLEKSSAQLIEKNSIIYSSRAPIGHINIVPFTYTTNQGCKSITPLIVNSNFLYYILQSLKEEIVRQGSGTTFKEISLTTFSNIKLPLPPLSEQQRIVSKIEELFAELDKIDEAQETYDNAANKLREKVLDTAMRGKLVPQDPNDEPASELLKRIEDEKQKLIEQKVIKKEANIMTKSVYSLPQGWEWTNFQNIIKTIKYGYTTKAQDSGNTKFLRITDIKDGSVDLDKVPYCEIKNTEFINYKIEIGDILIARSGSVGKSFIVPHIDEPVVYASYLIRLRLVNKALLPFIKLYLDSPLYWKQLNNTAFGNVLKNVNTNSLKSLSIPIPPLKEQERIINLVQKITKLL